MLREPSIRQNDVYLLQHFKGWLIETQKEIFNGRVADLMNFRTEQRHGCTFVYVLPLSANKALIEYTLFTDEVLNDEEYDKGLGDFISNELSVTHYKVIETEKGIIPMTNMEFPVQEGKVIFIGTAGGHTKASTGYTFSFIQKHSEAIVSSLVKNEAPSPVHYPRRFSFYDSVLLEILKENRSAGANIFYTMFKKNPADRIFRFLDNESSLFEEWKIMSSTNKRLFIPAALRCLGRLF
jgi:lycopene beta-cyclase